jgi:LPS export ABC transporter protein LptC
MIKQFLFMVVLISITGSLLLIWESPPESFLRSKTAVVEQLPSADSYMKNIKSYGFSTNGDREFTLVADKMAFYSGSSQLTVTKPIFSSETAESEKLQISADSGLLFKKDQIFEFSGNVSANWHNIDNKSFLKAEKLSYLLIKNMAQASGGVSLTTPQTKITGAVLSADFPAKVYKIESGVRAIHESI